MSAIEIRLDANVDERSALTNVDEFAVDLIRSLNKERGDRVAYNLLSDSAPTNIKKWISTGSIQLDYIISNRRNGGLPVGRVVEVFGPPSIGKSHIALQVAKSTQSMGGVVVYIDSENATNIENLSALGIDVGKRFVYVETACTQEAFAIAEHTLIKAREMKDASKKDVPITIIWDSVAASSPKEELDGEYDASLIGVQARAISKGMRKITQVIANQNALFLVLNQTRMAVGVMYGDPEVTPGGKAIPFHSSVRIRLGRGAHIKDSEDRVIGIHVVAKTVKNKVAYPFRSVEFGIHFGKGIVEHEQLFDVLRNAGEQRVNDHVIEASGEGAWKEFKVIDALNKKTLHARKFHKSEFADKVLNDPVLGSYACSLIEHVFVLNLAAKPAIDVNSMSEVNAAASLNE